MPILQYLRGGSRSSGILYSLSKKKGKKFTLNCSQRERPEDFNQKSDITVIMFGKTELISVCSKRGAEAEPLGKRCSLSFRSVS